MYEVNYTEAVKELTFSEFKESFAKVEQFAYYSTRDWEKEYFKATGKKVEKKQEKGE